MKNRKNAKLASALIGAAVVPVAAVMMSPASANAAVTVTITDLGTPTVTNGSISLANYEAYDITISATDGNITGVDLGQSVSGIDSTNGIFYTGSSGGFIQQTSFTPPSTSVGTPVNATKNNGGANNARSLAFDSHLLVTTGRVDVTAPFENSDSSNPIPGSTTAGQTTTGIDWGYGTYIKGLFGLSTPVQTLDLAYVVIPKTAGSGSIVGSIGDSSSVNPETFSAVFPTATTTSTTPPTAHNIVNLTTTTQTGGNYGVQLTQGTGNNQATFNPNTPVAGNINVTKVGAGSYIPGFANAVNNGTGDPTDFTAVSGFASGDQEIYALKLKVGAATPTSTQISSIVADITGETGTGISSVANLLSPSAGLATQIAALFPGYDLMLTVTSGSTTPFLGFDFTQETNVAGVLVTDIAVVPEPASAAVLLLGASSLLMGRRKRTTIQA